MLLAIDCGNTNTVFTLFEAETKLSEWRLETVSRRPADEYFIALCHVLESQKLYYTDIENCILASVVPDVTHHIVQFWEERLAVTPMVVGEEGVKLNLDIQTDDPAQVGADRLVNVAVAASGTVPAIILDWHSDAFDVVQPADPGSNVWLFTQGESLLLVHCSLEALVRRNYRAAYYQFRPRPSCSWDIDTECDEIRRVMGLCWRLTGC